MKKKLFYYSEKKLKYIEITNFYSRFVTLLFLVSAIFGLIFLGSYLLISDIVNPQESYNALIKENQNYKEKFGEVTEQINSLYSEINNLTDKENDLRLSVNLEPLKESDKNIGIGGASFNNIDLLNFSELKDVVEEVDRSMDLLNTKVLVAKNNYSNIEESLEENVKLFECIPAIIPSKGPIGDRFGMRKHPILKIRRMHPGIDIVVNTGTQIFAPGNGKVLKVGYRGGYGLSIEIDHGFGYTTLYAHLSKTKVKKGASVNRGDLIGLSGKSGRLATGPHLHYEVKHNGIHLNPKNFIFSDMKIFDQLTEKGSIQEYN